MEGAVSDNASSFRNFTNYRLLLLLRCGVTWQTSQTARLRGHSPHFVA
jgi:hypothetical protein